MRQAVGGKFVAAQRLDEPRHLPRPARHERAFERGHPAAVQNARGDAHDVFRRRADFGADDVVPVIKADQIALEIVGERLFEGHVVAIDDHAVGNARREILNMPGADPHGDFIGGDARPDEDFGEALARFHFDALHAQDENFIGHVRTFPDAADKAAQPLRADGNDDDLRPFDRSLQIAGERDALVQSDVFVFARLFEDFVGIIVLRAPGIYVLPLFRCEIPGDERAPAPAPQNGYFLQFSLR